MLKITVFIVLLISLNLEGLGQNLPPTTPAKQFSIGETFTLQSPVLGQIRTVNVYLPASYHGEEQKSYPVIYLLDGSADEDFIHIAGLVQFGSFSWINMIPETIVVGISNIDRKKDFTYPSNYALDQEELPSSGGSEQFIDFIRDELKPTIEKNYRIEGESTIIGQSLGGLLATEILFKQPDSFDNYIILSPSLWWDEEVLLKYELRAWNSPKSIFVGVGKEGELMERVAHELHAKLEKHAQERDKIFFHFFEEQDHGDVLHLGAYRAFEKLFSKE